MESLETKYGHIFLDGEDQYIFIKVVGSGADANAQLVSNVQTGELVVRKVDKGLYTEEETEQEEDREKVLFLLQSQAHQRGVQPNICHIHSADDVPSPQRRDQEVLYHRVRYLEFYNGGTLGGFWQACKTRDLAPPPSLILTMLRDLSQALNFMYSVEPSFVMHGDMHAGNIFLNWDSDTSWGPRFFLGDFGRSTRGGGSGSYYDLLKDMRQLWWHTSDLLNTGTDVGLQSELKKYLEEVVEPELDRLACGPMSQLPSLTRLLELLSTAPAASSPDMRPFMFNRESLSTPSPLLYNTSYEARGARGIHGPWHVGELSIDPSSGKLTIISMSPQTYHRPHLYEDYSDSEFEVDCADMV